MNDKQNHTAKFVLLSKLDAIVTIPDLSFSPDDKIWVLPVCCMAPDVRDQSSFDTHFNTPDSEGDRYRQILIANGASSDNITFLNYYGCLSEACLQDIASSRCVVFTGGRMEFGMDRLRKLQLDSFFARYTGTVVGVSAGALMLFSQYLVTPNKYYKALEVCDGFGFLDGQRLMIEVHYSEDDSVQRQAVETVCAARKQPIHAISERGYLIVENNAIIAQDGVQIIQHKA